MCGFKVRKLKKLKKTTLYQALKGYGCHRHYYNETEEEVKARKERKKNEFHARWEHNIKRLKGLNLKVLLNLKKLNLGPYSLNLVN